MLGCAIIPSALTPIRCLAKPCFRHKFEIDTGERQFREQSEFSGGIAQLANTQSAKKRIRSSARKQERNRHFRVSARTYIKKTRLHLREGDLEKAEAAAREAASTLDKAARKGILHPRNAARRKGRLMKAVAAAKASAGQ